MNYLITGGGFGNKGAESMLYTAICELRKKEPECEITVLCLHGFLDLDFNSFNNINILPDIEKPRKKLLSPFYCIRRLFNLRSDDLIRTLENEFKKADVVIDISGFSVSSLWGKFQNRNVLSTIKLGKKYGCKVFLFPQSFGPFNYTKKHKVTLKEVKNTLKKVDLIFCREHEGYDMLKILGLKNIALSSDMVLQNRFPYKGIYKIEPPKCSIEVKPKSVLIIPSQRILERSDVEDFYNLYLKIVESLTEKGFNIYFSFYAHDDIPVLNELKSKIDKKNVTFIEDELSCIDYSQILDKFEFIITSRFHSAVHAYKNNVPAMVIGWAVKYQELTKNLEQQNMMFDCKEKIDADIFIEKMNYLIENLEEEKKKIKKNLTKIQINNCFDKFWSVLGK